MDTERSVAEMGKREIRTNALPLRYWPESSWPCGVTKLMNHYKGQHGLHSSFFNFARYVPCQ